MSKEIRKEVRTFLVHLKCNCGGKMLATGMCLTSDPPQYPHECVECDLIVNKDTTYPCIQHEEINQ